MAALGLAGCGASDVPADELEDSIRAYYTERQMPLETIDCPEDLAADEDTTLICQISFSYSSPGGFEYDRVRVEVNRVDNQSVYYDMILLAVGEPDDSPADGQQVVPDDQGDSPTEDQTDEPTGEPSEGED